VLVLPCRLASPTSTLVHRAVAYALNHVMPDKWLLSGKLKQQENS